MKKAILAILAGFALLLTGCASTSTGTAPTPAQIIAQVNAQVCPGVTAALTVAQTLPELSAADQGKLADASKTIGAVCAANTGLNAADLQSLAESALPVILAAIKVAPVFPEQAAIVNGIGAAQILLPILIAQAQAATLAK